MNASNPPLPVVAGIDGSDTAIGAAQWAVDEAVSRNVPLRLVYVTKAPHPTAEEYDRDIHHAHASLRAAQDAIEAGGQPVKIETALIPGPPGPALVEESRDAAMVCVGSVGIGRYARSILGSTATDLAEKAHCPVAIIRPQQDESRQDVNWIVVAVNEDPDNGAVVEQALREAELRDAPVLAIGEHLARHGDRAALEAEVGTWRQRHPGVHVYPVADKADVAHFLKHHDERVQLAVIGGSEAAKLDQIIGPFGHSALHHTNSSVLVIQR